MALPLPPDPAQWQAVLADASRDRLSPAAHWYFSGQWIALDPQQQPSPPIWLVAPQLRCRQRLQAEPLAIRQLDSSAVTPLALVPALASNPTFINQDTLRYLARHPLRIRSELNAGQADEPARARSLWPEDWRIEATAALLADDWHRFVLKGESGAQQPFCCQRLWQRDEQTDRDQSSPRWAIGVMLNGAQGDDDEAHGGHFALTLGRWRDDGDIADWLVANFYNPDVVSEKGILPALVPMDNYLTDINSGQQQYRPSWLVACDVADEQIASALYVQLLTTLERLYDHRVQYQHTDNNCTGLSMDALRAAGIQVPCRGASSHLLAPLLFTSTLLRERSWREARKASRYLLAEQTRLLPWQAFEACVEHLLGLLRGSRTAGTEIEHRLISSTRAVYGLHFPQLPSARAWGREPAVSLFDYQRRVPPKRADWKIIPVPARELPAELKRTSP
ncbi:hypothetical protein HPT27_07570 [Permianibacter sp. IMCC34836]|uniref:hypothetical protein n=1 Tax=Permianibacter fluminis TaxID=2738515 RepID=UPI0015562997|nr:hypothetical protein [Permianibacter fluminis]NQD36882.1 hypothetical protein [Permianibacter fluminis]